MAHQAGALALIDSTRIRPAFPCQCPRIRCGFHGILGHKMCGPTGIGVLYGKEALLEAMPPFIGGGEIDQENFIYALLRLMRSLTSSKAGRQLLPKPLGWGRRWII